MHIVQQMERASIFGRLLQVNWSDVAGAADVQTGSQIRPVNLLSIFSVFSDSDCPPNSLKAEDIKSKRI